MNNAEHDSPKLRLRSVRRPLILILFAAVCFAGGFLTKAYFRTPSENDATLDGLAQKLDELGRSVEGRLDTLSRSVFDRRDTSAISDPTIGPISAPTPESPIVPVAELIEDAEDLRSAGNLREAEILLTRAVQTDRDDVSAWRALAALQREMARTSLAAGDLQNAAKEADRGRTSVNGIMGLCIEPTQTFDPKIATEEDSAISEVIAEVRSAIDQECQRCIKSAWNSKEQGSAWYWWNDRQKTVDGLKHLQKVTELGPWASPETRMSATEAFSALKKMVKQEEWNDLLSKAGFDPTSRESLPNWGLE